MPKQRMFRSIMVSMLVVAAGTRVEAGEAPFRTAMMDMMPMGGAMQQPAPGGAAMPSMPTSPGVQAVPAPTGGGMGAMMGDDMARMGGGMPAQAQNPMPMGQAPQQPSTGACPMMAMMQNMMRMGAAQQGMAPMQGGSSPGGAMGMDMGSPAGGTQPMGSSAARLDGRIAFLRTELRITDAQAPAWDSFAATLRAGREHLDAARTALQDSGTGADPMARLESFENHLKARTEAIHMTRMAFGTLYGQLDEAQKRMATTTMLPFIGSY